MSAVAMFLSTNNIGDADTWPEAFAWVGLGLCALGAYYVWARWGRDDQ